VCLHAGTTLDPPRSFTVAFALTVHHRGRPCKVHSYPSRLSILGEKHRRHGSNSLRTGMEISTTTETKVRTKISTRQREEHEQEHDTVRDHVCYGMSTTKCRHEDKDMDSHTGTKAQEQQQSRGSNLLKDDLSPQCPNRFRDTSVYGNDN
jgi:hypothetical protein